jgi:hypothetical protein
VSAVEKKVCPESKSQPRLWEALYYLPCISLLVVFEKQMLDQVEVLLGEGYFGASAHGAGKSVRPLPPGLIETVD